MKRLLSFAASVAMLAAFALPVHAQSLPSCPPPVPGQTTSCTLHITDVSLPPMPVQPITCPDGSVIPGGMLATTIETGVFHFTVDGAGDFWGTTTMQGSFTFTAAPSGTVYTGHFMEWFGVEANNMNFVRLGNLTFVGMAADGSTISLHLVFHLSFSADGQVTFFMNTTC
jgi:hypothetical protein